MKAFVFTCLLAVAASSPLLPGYYGSPLLSPLVLSPIAPLVHYPSSGAIVPADAPDVAAAKILHAQAHHEALSRGKRAAAYYGPPAPLNSDGTVARTPEVAAAAAYQNAAHAQEYRRLADAAALAAAHPDTTSPQGSWDGPQQQWNGPQQQWNGPQQQWNAPQQQWNAPQQQWSGRSYNPAASQPAPLNADGTVAPTREYQAIAAAHAAAHQQLAPAHAPHYGRRRRSVRLNPDGTVAPTPEVAAATAAHLAALSGARGHSLAWGAPAVSYASPYAHIYHAPAPLNVDGTVAETPEVAHLSAAHRAAQAQQLGILAAQEALAVAAGPGEEGYAPAWNAAPVYASGRAYYQPAPLNHDGTVAHTPEYLAIAASHAAAHHHY